MDISKSSSASYNVDKKKYDENYQRMFGASYTANVTFERRKPFIKRLIDKYACWKTAKIQKRKRAGR